MTMNQRSIKFFSIIFVASIVSFIQTASAQTIELNAFTGWQLNGTAKLYEGDFRIEPAQNYGGKFAVGLSSLTSFELSYMRTDTKGRYYPYFSGITGDDVEFSLNYIQIGGVQAVDLGRIHPFGTITAGITVWSPKTSGYSSYTQFSMTAGAGLKIWLSDMIGLRLQGTMLMPMVYNGAGFGCGIGTGGSGCSGGLYTRITPFQGEFSGGVIIRISPNK
jgi:hypothetical protein